MEAIGERYSGYFEGGGDASWMSGYRNISVCLEWCVGVVCMGVRCERELKREV